MPKIYGQRCPVAKTLEVVGERWTLLVIRDPPGGARRFRDLQAGLPGLAPNILSERLKLMEEHGLVSRRFYSDHPPRAEYELTDRGASSGRWSAPSRPGEPVTWTRRLASSTATRGRKFGSATSALTRASASRPARSASGEALQEVADRAVEGLRLIPVAEVPGR